VGGARERENRWTFRPILGCGRGPAVDTVEEWGAAHVLLAGQRRSNSEKRRERGGEEEAKADQTDRGEMRWRKQERGAGDRRAS
jgi:hypothetical protein